MDQLDISQKNNEEIIEPEFLDIRSLSNDLVLIRSDLSDNKFNLGKLWAFMGPGFLVSIAYIDPGNFETDIQAGVKFQYSLIQVLVLATFLGLVLQTLAARLGIITELHLAKMCRFEYPKFVRILLQIISEITIIASDIPEVLGSAIALKLLIGTSLQAGVLISSFSVLIFLAVSYFGIRKLEAVIGFMIAIIFVCFTIQFFMSEPPFTKIMTGFIPRISSKSLYTATSLIGAVVMPHNLFLHSALVGSRKLEKRTQTSIKEACLYNLIESSIALLLSLFINISVLCLAANEFYNVVDKISLIDSPVMLKKLLGKVAPILFSVALLASGQSSTMTGTLAGQYVMEGFLDLKIRPQLRALITRISAILPSLSIALLAGENGADDLIIFSQALLALLLPFALVPLVKFTSSRKKMGDFTNKLQVIVCTSLLGIILTFGNICVVQITLRPYFNKLNAIPKIFLIIFMAIFGLLYLIFIGYLIFTKINMKININLEQIYRQAALQESLSNNQSEKEMGENVLGKKNQKIKLEHKNGFKKKNFEKNLKFSEIERLISCDNSTNNCSLINFVMEENEEKINEKQEKLKENLNIEILEKNISNKDFVQTRKKKFLKKSKKLKNSNKDPFLILSEEDNNNCSS